MVDGSWPLHARNLFTHPVGGSVSRPTFRWLSVLIFAVSHQCFNCIFLRIDSVLVRQIPHANQWAQCSSSSASNAMRSWELYVVALPPFLCSVRDRSFLHRSEESTDISSRIRQSYHLLSDMNQEIQLGVSYPAVPDVAVPYFHWGRCRDMFPREHDLCLCFIQIWVILRHPFSNVWNDFCSFQCDCSPRCEPERSVPRRRRNWCFMSLSTFCFQEAVIQGVL